MPRGPLLGQMPILMGPTGGETLVKERGLAANIISYLGGLRLLGGDHDGEPFKVLDWEQAFIEGAFAPDSEVSALSIARGNGKSCLLAGVAASGVAPGGPPPREGCRSRDHWRAAHPLKGGLQKRHPKGRAGGDEGP